MLAGDYGKVSMKVLCEGWGWLTFPKGPPIPAQGCRRCRGSWGYMSYSLNSLKGGYIEDYIGDYYRGY